MNDDEALKIIKAKTAQLTEHFETVQVFVTIHESDGNTKSTRWGSGNYFARVGQVQMWLDEQKAENTRDQVDG